MSDVQELQDLLTNSQQLKPVLGTLTKWMKSGEPDDCEKIKAPKAGYLWVEHEVSKFLSDHSFPELHRVLVGLARAGGAHELIAWLRKWCNDAEAESLLKLCEEVDFKKEWDEVLAHWTLDQVFLRAGKPTVAGKWLISKSAAFWKQVPATVASIDLHVQKDLSSLAQWLDGALRGNSLEEIVEVVAHAIKRAGNQVKQLVMDRREKSKDSFGRFLLSRELMALDPAFRRSAMEDAWETLNAPTAERVDADDSIYGNRHGGLECATWLLENDPDFPSRISEWGDIVLGIHAGGGVKDKKRKDDLAREFDEWVAKILAILQPGSDARYGQLMMKMAESSTVRCKLAAMSYVLASMGSKGAERVTTELRKVLELRRKWSDSLKDLPGYDKIETYQYGPNRDAQARALVAKEMVDFLGVLTPQVAGNLLPEILESFGDRSSKVRTAAMVAVIRLGSEAIPKVAPLLEASSKDVRLTAARALGGMATAEAARLVEARLDEEKVEDVRDAMFDVLDHYWTSIGREYTDEEIEARVARAAKAMAKFKPLDVPSLMDLQGKALPREWVQFALWRQSRYGEMGVDPQARPIIGRVDKSKAGAFALAVLELFMDSSQNAKDKWMLCVTGLLGDDRIPRKLKSAIDAWAKKSRGALAEFAVRAMALIGTQVALQTVDDVANSYRSKNKNIGAAAAQAFEDAAKARGMTADELGDAVVPWLGFEAGKDRIVKAKNREFTVRVGKDGKLVYRDEGKDRPTVPTGVTAEVKAEMKELGALLREAMKAQVRRHSRMLVQQRRWSIEKWTSLYRELPVLSPFLTQFVWGVYEGNSGSGGPAVLFRGLPDGTLTDAEDNAVTLPKSGSIGLVHPLELGEEQLAAWRQHLADYEVLPPVPQFERAIVRVREQDRTKRVYTAIKGTSLNAFTFKGRAERLGWHRGSVVDGGGIDSYMKSFPAAGVDVILNVDGMFIGIGLEDSVTLEQAMFVRGGSVKVGSYTYDEPTNESDPRVVAFGDVPPIVFSETMAELTAISGKKEEGEGEEGGV